MSTSSSRVVGRSGQSSLVVSAPVGATVTSSASGGGAGAGVAVIRAWSHPAQPDPQQAEGTTEPSFSGETPGVTETTASPGWSGPAVTVNSTRWLCCGAR